MKEFDIKKKMQEMFDKFSSENGCTPEYAYCTIRFLDDNTETEETFKMDCGAGEGDDDMFYFCNGLADLQSMTEEGSCNDFIITDILVVR